MSGDFLNGLEVVGICIAAIVVLLALLILFLYGFGYLFRNRKSETQFIAPDGTVDPHIVAAVTACISYFYETKKPEDHIEFVVKNIRRK